MTSWQVRLAALLAWLGVLPGVFCFYLAALAFRNTDDMLLFVMPIIGTAAAIGGFVIAGGSVGLALRLQQQHPAARLQALVAGVGLALMGLFVLTASPVAGLLLLLYGGTLAYLVCTPAAARDLGPWRRAVQQPAPWGRVPGRGLWAPGERAPQLHPNVEAGPVQGPWAPDPRTIPWLSWKNHSGPRAPWWQTWQAGLAQGIPVWELVLLVAALVAVLTGNVLVLLGLTGSAYLGTLGGHGSGAAIGLLLLAVGIGVVALLEKRMRTRLATRR